MKEKNIIFGTRAIIEAVKSGKELDKVLLKKDLRSETSKELFALLRELEIPFQYVPVQKLDRITGKNHQGAIAYISQISYHNIDQIIPTIFEQGRIPLVLVLDQITDVRNFGAIIRTAECAGVDAVIIPSKGAAQINEDSIKTSAGAIFKIPICRSADIRESVKYLINSGLSVYAASEKASEDYFKADYNKPLALIVGSEEFGVSNELLQLSEKSLRIPIYGEIASLNVSSALAVIIFEAVKQRNFLTK